MRTAGQYLCDTPHTGGWLFYGALNANPFSANLVITRNALGDYSYNRTAGGAETYNLVLDLAEMKRGLESLTTGGFPFQEQFGSSVGAAGYPAGAAGIPPFSGNTQLTQPTAQPAKGIKVTDVVVVYKVGVVDLTSAALSLNRTVFANNTALAITNVPIDATALPLTAAGDATGPYTVVRSVTTPAFETTDLSDLTLDFQVVMANTGTFRYYGMGCHITFNYD